jgi:hypothetical protein
MIRRRLAIIAATVGLLFAVGAQPFASAAPAKAQGDDVLCVVVLRKIVICPI